MNRIHHNTNENLKQLTSETLIIGVDISKASHVARAVDFRGMELSGTLSFRSDVRGFDEFRSWMAGLMAMHGKTGAIVGLEPTGPYGNTLIQHLKRNGVRTVLVLGAQVAAAKELDDNTPSKNDFKDALTICGLIRDGRFRRLREFNEATVELKEAMAIHRQLTKDVTRAKCRIDNWICQYFPEFAEVFKDWTKKTAYATLKACPTPRSVLSRTPEELVRIWRRSGVIKGVGIRKAEELHRRAKGSAGLTGAPEFAEMHIRGLISQHELLVGQSEDLWAVIDELVKDIPLYGTLSGIPCIGKKAICGIIAEIGDPLDFPHPQQLVRLAGLSLRESSSGGRRGASQISKRGRPRLRHWLYIAVLELLKRREPAFWALHRHYTTREENPLRKMQSVIALCCKLLRTIHGMCANGTAYDPRLVTAGIPAPAAA